MLPEREFNELLVQFTPYVRFQVRRRSRGEANEDAVQDVLLDAVAKRENYDPARGSFVSWLYYLVWARMQANRLHERKRRHLQHDLDATYDKGEPVLQPIAIEGDPHARLELVEVLDAVKTLKPKQAEIVMQRATGATFGEISTSFGVSKQYIEQLHVKGLTTLRKRTGRKQLKGAA